MFKKILIIFLFIPLFGYAEKDFIALTIPKSGTHLLEKLFYLLLDEREKVRYTSAEMIEGDNCSEFFSEERITSELIEDLYTKIHEKNQWLLVHLNRSNLFKAFVKKHPSVATIILIRDLRDVSVSLTHYSKRHIKRAIGEKSSFPERLNWVIKGGGSAYENSIMNIQKHAKNAYSWIDHPNSLLVRFEDLCGARGGGSAKKQKETILRICEHLSISISEEKLQYVRDNLWGPNIVYSSTFRKGKIGSWKKEFSSRHKKNFKRRMGQQLIDLGYETNYNW